MTQFYFRPPNVSEGPAGGGRLFIRYRLTKGITVLRTQGVWSEIRYPSEDQTRAAEWVFWGGYRNTISEIQRTGLIDAGYGNYISLDIDLTAQANPGATVLSIASTSGISVGDYASAPALRRTLITDVGVNQITIATPVASQVLFVGELITVSK